MSWLGELERELDARGVRGAARRRILLELADHLACEPDAEARLGEPAGLAATFADQLGTDRTRRGAREAFAALVLAAVAFLASQLTVGAAGGPHAFDAGLSVALWVPALLAVVLGSQIALVAGTLALLRAWRRRGPEVLPSAELALVRRRAAIGVGAGMVTVVGLLAYVVDFVTVLPAWWLALVGGLAWLAGIALAVAGARLVRAGETVVTADGPAGDLFDDLPPLRGLRAHPWRLCALAALLVGAGVLALAGAAEGSLAEGVQRGAFEALAVVVAFTALGRAVGARR
jgi:hypothetical protein